MQLRSVAVEEDVVMDSSARGFQGAPVSLGLVWAAAGGSVFASATNTQHLWHLPPSFLASETKQAWRLASGNLVFATSRELFFGAYLIYYCRVFERRMGSNKFASFVFVTSAMSTLLQIGITQLCHGCYPLASGPFGLIFGCAAPFVMDLPVSSKFSVLGLPLTDKALVMAMGAQLLLTSWKRTFIPGICGILAGTMYRVNFLGMRKFRIPSFLSKLFKRTIGKILAAPLDQAGPTVHPGRSTDGSRPGTSASGQREYTQWLAEPSPEAVELLVSMGFDRTLASRALQQSDNDVNLATNRLLEGNIQ